jgi:hypothetical protein
MPGLFEWAASRGEAMIMHNPLDNLIVEYAGRATSPEAIFQDYPYQFADSQEVEKLLKNWVERHKNDCQVIRHVPYIVKVFVTSKDIDVYNRNMHAKNQARRRYR